MMPTRAAAPNIPDFTPVPVRQRSDGWTDARQRGFIATLAATGSVAVAADSVGLDVSGAYALRARTGAASFVRAWNEALDAGIAALKTVAFDRAVNGVPVTLLHHGAEATTTRYDNRLLMSLLRHYDRPGTAAAASETPHGPSTDTATIMWHGAIALIGKGQILQIGNAFLLKHLLILQRDPTRLEEAIGIAKYMLKKSGEDLDLILEQVNAGPEGMRGNAAGVTHTLKPIVLTTSQREVAEQVVAHLRGHGPAITAGRAPVPVDMSKVPSMLVDSQS